MATQVVILRAVRDFVPHLARLENATTAFFNGLLGRWKKSHRGGVYRLGDEARLASAGAASSRPSRSRNSSVRSSGSLSPGG